MKPADDDRLGRLLTWSESHGAVLNPSVEVYSDDVTKFSLRVKPGADEGHRIEPGEAVVSCPVSTTLSYLNALAGSPIDVGPSEADKSVIKAPTPAFPDRFMEATPPHVIGRFFLIQQFLLGRESYWSPYIEALPQPEQLASWSLPAFWAEDDVDLLDGTNAYVAIEEIQNNVSREFKRARKLLKELGYSGWQDYSRPLYNWAFCIFTSRSFRPSLVVSQEVRQVWESRLPDGCKFDDFSILLPLFDIANHSPTARIKWDVETDPGAAHFKTGDEYTPGQQIFNNYGSKTNSELLLGYGFILPETEALHNDYIHLRKRTALTEPGTGESDKTDTKPRDFLISLRPMSHPSSVVGRARQQRTADAEAAVPAEFGLFEDALLWDLCTTLWGPSDRKALEKETGAPIDALAPGDLLGRVFTADPKSPLSGLVERIRQTLLAKLASDYERLAEVEVSEDASLNQNQLLALQYREQYAKVLRNAVQALDPDVQLIPV